MTSQPPMSISPSLIELESLWVRATHPAERRGPGSNIVHQLPGACCILLRPSPQPLNPCDDQVVDLGNPKERWWGWYVL
jgi:hypothetical protein